MKRFIGISILYLTLSCGTQKHSDFESKEVMKLIDDYYAVMSDRDWPAYRSFFWDDATITTVWQEQVQVQTIDEFIEKTPEGPDSQPIFEEKATSVTVKVRGNIATTWCDYDARFGTKDSLMTWSGTDVSTWMKYDEEWKIVSLVFQSE